MYKEFLAIIYKAFVIKRNTVTHIIVYEFSENFNIITHVCSNSKKTKKLPSEINRIVCIHVQNLPSPFIAQDLYFYMHVISRPPLIVQYEYFFFGNKNHLKNCNHFKQRIRTHFDCPAATVNLHRGSRDSNIPLILIKWTNNPFILRERIYINEHVTWVDIISLALAKVAIPDSSDRRLSKGALAELKHHDFCTFIYPKKSCPEIFLLWCA